VPFHRAGPDEQLRADLRVGPPVPGQPGDLLLLRGQVGPGVLDPPAHLLPGGQQLSPGPFGETLGAHGRERLVRGPQLATGLGPPVLAAQPLAVAQPGPGQVYGHPGPAQPVERLAVQLIRRGPVGQQRQGPRRRPAGPVGAARRGDLRQLSRRLGGPLLLVAPDRRFHQLVPRPRRDDQLAGGAGALRGLGGELVVAEAVVQHGRGVLGDGQRRALAPVRGPPDHLLGQLAGGRRVPPPRGEQQRDVRKGGRPDPRVDAFALRQQGRRGRQLTRLDLDLGQVVERERKPAQRAVSAGQPDLAGGELEPRPVVPQVHRDQAVGDAPPVQLLRPGPVPPQRLAEQGRGGRVPVGQPHRQAAEQPILG